MAFEALWTVTQVGARLVLTCTPVLAGLGQTFIYVFRVETNINRKYMCALHLNIDSKKPSLCSTCLTVFSTEAFTALTLVGSDQVPTRTAVQTRLGQALIDLCRK